MKLIANWLLEAGGTSVEAISLPDVRLLSDGPHSQTAVLTDVQRLRGQPPDRYWVPVTIEVVVVLMSTEPRHGE